MVRSNTASGRFNHVWVLFLNSSECIIPLTLIATELDTPGEAHSFPWDGQLDGTILVVVIKR